MDVKIIRVDARGANKDESILKRVNDEVKSHLVNSVADFGTEIHIANITNDKGEVYYAVIKEDAMNIYYDNNRRYEAVKDTIEEELPASYCFIGDTAVYTGPEFDIKDIINGNRYIVPGRPEYLSYLVERYKGLGEID